MMTYEQSIAYLKNAGQDVEGVFEVRTKFLHDTITFDNNKEIYSGGIKIFDDFSKPEELKSKDANLGDTKKRRLVIGIHAFTDVALKTTDVSQQLNDLKRLTYGTKLVVSNPSGRPVEELMLWQMVNYKITNNGGGLPTATSLKIVTDIAQQGLDLQQNPIAFNAENGKTIEVKFPSGLTTAITGVAKPIIPSAKIAYGNEGMPPLTEAGTCYSITFHALVMEWLVGKDK